MQTDTILLQMALIGYEAERQKIQEKIAEIQRQLNGRTRQSGPLLRPPETRTKRTMSASARRRIAAAQKRRWAEYRKKQRPA